MAAHVYQAHCALWNHFTIGSQSSHVWSESDVITSIIQMRTLRVREGMWFASGHTARGWLRWSRTRGCDATSTLLVFTLYTQTVFWASTSSLVCTPVSSFLHHCRHWDSFASCLNPKHNLLWSSTAPCISVFLSLAPPLHFLLFGQFAFALPRNILLPFWSRQLVCWHSNTFLYVVEQRHRGDKVRTGHWRPRKAEEPRFQEQCFLCYLSLGTDIFGEL